MTFLPVDHRKQAAYGRIVEVDEASGRMRPLGGIARPRSREWIEDEAIELDGALRLEGGRIALHGGFGSGPFSWWVALMRLDGTLRSGVGIWNDYRVLSTRSQYPWDLTGGRTPLTGPGDRPVTDPPGTR